jgi:hypothetical protein
MSVCLSVSASICLLHPVHSPTQAFYILDEVVLGGLVLETSLNEITIHADAQAKLEKTEVWKFS